jgi:hypothetical protein
MVVEVDVLGEMHGVRGLPYATVLAYLKGPEKKKGATPRY